MTKAELVDVVADGAKISKAAATKAIDSLVKGITKSLKRGDKVPLVDFGTFSVNKRKARKGRNPRTGTEIKKVPKSVAGKTFTEGISLEPLEERRLLPSHIATLSYVEEHGPCTIKEIAENNMLGSSIVREMVSELKELGFDLKEMGYLKIR